MSVVVGFQIHGFRMALWEEHSAIIHPSFYHPSSMECVEQMRNIGKTNWEVCMPRDLSLQQSSPHGEFCTYLTEVSHTCHASCFSTAQQVWNV